ncbi:hypothetical protein JTB14_017825 [Gonioctena quinquepunctata]|nr:hypothetical protein JTB14_017825 [Gonioctena quinquepunctata]
MPNLVRFLRNLGSWRIDVENTIAVDPPTTPIITILPPINNPEKSQYDENSKDPNISQTEMRRHQGAMVSNMAFPYNSDYYILKVSPFKGRYHESRAFCERFWALFHPMICNNF